MSAQEEQFKNFYDSILRSTRELGGFAEDPEDVSDACDEEEMQREFENFNYCLAEDYALSMRNEDFAVLGDISPYLIGNICKWINYKEELGNANLEKGISDGTLITKNNRTFIDAIVANKRYDYAYAYTERGVYQPALIHLLMEGYAEGKEDTKYPCRIYEADQEKFDKINDGLYLEIEKNYQNAEDKSAYLQTIREGIKAIRFEDGLKQKPLNKSLPWVQALANNK